MMMMMMMMMMVMMMRNSWIGIVSIMHYMLIT